ncbi:MAG: 9-O-acetylesterase, partial [Daejeonella sp.]|nr:9-O-acetylesterase [Daejeonella sp.]
SILTLSVHVSEAKVILPSVFSDNMVFQQKANAAIWGKTKPGKTVFVSGTWNGKKYKTIADQQGNWKIKVATPSYGGPYAVNINDGDLTVLRNVLIGEVWVCSGQSNMEMPLAGWGQIENYQNEISDGAYPQIRLLQAVHVTSNKPLENAEVTNGGWQACNPETVKDFSSTAYFFAREIYQKTKIPIGLIHTSWGGTIAEAWTSTATLKELPDFAQAAEEIKNTSEQSKEEYAKKVEEWEISALAKDAGYSQNKPVWAGNDFDASSWKSMNLPVLWEKSALPDFDGAVWFRKKIVIPATWAGKDLKLDLGPIDDDDVTWFNGVTAGKTNGYNVPRKYTIPANLVKAGENIITVRVFDGAGGGGIYGETQDLNITSENGEKISLAGDWQYQIGAANKDFPARPAAIDGPNRPTVLYNAMINPFIQFAVKGFIWYQGESNAGRAYQYR